MARGNRRDRPQEGTFGARLYDAQTRWIEGAGEGDWRDDAFAKAVGSSVPSLSPYWNAIDPPNTHTLIIRIARTTGTDPGWLAYGSLSQAPMGKRWPAEKKPPVLHSPNAKDFRAKGAPAAKRGKNAG